MTDLGLLGGNTGTASAINRRGQVVGASDTASGGQHAFLWQNGTMTDLGTLGGAISAANDINDRGQVVGVSLTAAGAWHAFRWQGGAMTDLGAFTAWRINNSGQIVGTVGDAGNGEQVRAVRWDNGTLTPLTMAASAANDINNAGLIVGALTSQGGAERAFAWRDGRLATLSSLGGDSVAYAVNDRNRIVGMSGLAATGEPRPVMWVRSAVLDLTARGLPLDSFVVAINARDHLAGAVNGRAALFR
jgi:probable HAF family extracellular repeat protein